MFEDGVAVGMSGGMDSRILFGAIEKPVKCLTYGDSDFYETEIARRCARARGAEFQSYPMDKHQFPDKGMMLDYILETEALGINGWLPIIEDSRPFVPDGMFFLLGDMREAIPGRNIKVHSSREARIKNFISIVLLGRQPEFTP